MDHHRGVRSRHLVSAFAVVAALVLASCSSDTSDSSDRATTTDRTGAATGSANSTGGPDDADCDGSIEAPSTDVVVDRCGRVVILRGVNVESSAKQADAHLPTSDRKLHTAIQRDWGWNTVRFLVFWGAIEPEKGTYDDNYLDQVAEWVDWYRERNIHVVLDLHQDLYAWKVGGNGAPDWAVDTQGLTVAPPSEDGPWWLHGADPGVQAAYQSFWNPKDGNTELQDHYLAALTHLADRFKDDPAVIGYDVMNEPVFANGDLNATLALQAQAAKGEFHNQNLTRFMNNGIAAVRKVSKDQYVFIEPTSLLNAFPYPGDLIEKDIVDPRDGAPRIVYAGHLYEPDVHEGSGYKTTSTYVADWFRMRTAEAEEMKAALWFGEWGGTPDQERMSDYLADVTTAADQHLTGWAYWSWDPGGWSPIETDGAMSANGKDLQRVQPQAIAGTPKTFVWDATTKAFTMTWTDRPEVKAATELAVPAGLYADGVEVVLDGETVASPTWDRDTATLTLDADRTTAEHTVCVAPTGSTACA